MRENANRREVSLGGFDVPRGAQVASPVTIAPPPPEVNSLSPREVRARQLVLAADTLDAWRAKFEGYQTTRDSCLCPDFQIRRPPGGCKHQIAFRMLEDRDAAP